jgi:hypothetical protein
MPNTMKLRKVNSYVVDHFAFRDNDCNVGQVRDLQPSNVPGEFISIEVLEETQ